MLCWTFYDINYKNLKVANQREAVMTLLQSHNVFNKFAIFKQFWSNERS